MAIHRFPGEPEGEAEFWARHHSEQSEKNLAKHAVKPPGLNDYYAEQRQAQKEALQLVADARKAAIASGPHAMQVDLNRLPKNDPLVIRQKWLYFHPGEVYPGDDKIK